VESAEDVDGTNLVNVIGDLARLLSRLPSEEKLSLSTLGALSTLGLRGPMRLADLTSSEHVTQPAMTQIVTRLERDGLVKRCADPDDGRAVLVHITDAGTTLVASRHANRLMYVTQLFERLEPKERSVIISALPALIHFVELGNGA
jgi:DNA-binding MarR family transcriptional regulator